MNRPIARNGYVHTISSASYVSVSRTAEMSTIRNHARITFKANKFYFYHDPVIFVMFD